MNHNSTIQIAQSLRSACKFLDPEEDRQLIHDVELVCEQLVDPNFRIALLAPFNFGKSTLINSLLGQDIMPTKIVRTTGAAIRIKYGKVPTTLIALKSGEVIRSIDTNILKEFAVLKKGKQRDDVLSIEVFLPHSLLKNGIELLDLPGTNDRDEQNILISDQLLQVDLVIQVLNAQQPFTWDERETLRQWLVERGITTVLFALNRMNQLDVEKDRKEVYKEVYSIAKSFNSDLPKGINNLYRVDALPALKAKQKRDILNIHKSGIAIFTATLHTIAFFQRRRIAITRLPRALAVASRIRQALEKIMSPIYIEVKNAEDIRNSKIERGKEREKSLQAGFKDSVKTLHECLSSRVLLATYESEGIEALTSQEFVKWQNSKFKEKITDYIDMLEEWVDIACDEFEQDSPQRLSISFPSQPVVSLPSRKDRNAGQWVGDIFNGGKNRKKLDVEYEQNKWEAHKTSIHSYLNDFSRNALESLDRYEKMVEPLIIFPIPPELSEVIDKRNHVKLLSDDIQAISKIEAIGTNRNKGELVYFQKIISSLVFYKNWLVRIFGQ